MEKRFASRDVMKVIAEKMITGEDIAIYDLASKYGKKVKSVERWRDDVYEVYRLFKDTDPMLLVFEGAEVTHRLKHGTSAKKEIAGYIARSILEPGDSLILDAGSNIYELSKEMVKGNWRIRGVMTNNLLILSNLQQALLNGRLDGIFLTGGDLEHDLGALAGEEALSAIRSYGATKSVVGVGGIDYSGGLYCFRPIEVQIKAEMLHKAKDGVKVIIPCDSSKIGRATVKQFASLADIKDEQFTVVIDKVPSGKEGLINNLKSKFGQDHFHIL
jgi:DeoR/GlpR family transcriptional regulator of sugar metabolism